MKQGRLETALKLTFARRNTHDLPSILLSPPQEWEPAFHALATECDLNDPMDVIFRFVANFYERAVTDLKTVKI